MTATKSYLHPSPCCKAKTSFGYMSGAYEIRICPCGKPVSFYRVRDSASERGHEPDGMCRCWLCLKNVRMRV